MYTGLYSAVSGGMAQEERLAILTNNLANVTTAGFKADTTAFHATLVPMVVGEVQPPDNSSPVVMPVDPLGGQQAFQHPQVTVHTDFSQGPIRETGNPLDMALEGKGFFVIEGPRGEVAYTRQGTFSLNADGFLVTQDGLLVQGERGPLAVRGGHVEVDATGRVLVDGTFIDRLKLVDFSSPYPLEKVGNARFRPVGPGVQEADATDLTVHQGALELSNSPLVPLLSALVQTSRAFETYQRVIQIFDDTAGRAVNDIART